MPGNNKKLKVLILCPENDYLKNRDNKNKPSLQTLALRSGASRTLGAVEEGGGEQGPLML